MIKIVKLLVLAIYIKIVRIIIYLIRPFLIVSPNRILFIANSGKLYGCNPKYITEYILENDKEERFEIIWVSDRKHKLNLNARIKTVILLSLNYILAINTAGFVVNNFRTNFRNSLWIKSKKQKYIMTWHGGMPLKKIEGDVSPVEVNYMKMALLDSENCDLMMSSARFFDDVIRRAMVYNGELLKSGSPRNDIFFDRGKIDSATKKIKEQYNLCNQKIVLYAPTFRTNHNLECYNIDWGLISEPIKKILESDDVVILLRLHPDLEIKANHNFLKGEKIIDVSSYPDMQELMCAADVLLTDYSSVMFEFALMYKPCFIFASDIEDYDRGFYFDLKELPFSVSTDNDELADNINNFNIESYQKNLSEFFNNKIGKYEKGEASKDLYNWIVEHS